MSKLYVVFGEDFGRHPHCLEHLIVNLGPGHEVLWVETAGLRGPKLTWTDLKRSWQKISGWFKPSTVTLTSASKVPNWITIERPFSLPWWGNPFIRLINKISVVNKVRAALKKYPHPPMMVISSLPNTGDFLKQFNEKISIYYCVDEFKLWPGFPTQTIEKLENNILRKADLVLCTSSHLVESRARINPRTVLFTHGVDVKKFKIPAAAQTDKVILGYYGLVDERCDQDLMEQLSDNLVNAEIHIWGKVTVPIDALKAKKNIKFFGEVPYQNLASEIAGVHIFILPYKINEQTKTIYPLKIKEYLITGRPVVATHLPDMPSLAPYVRIAVDPKDFISHCQTIIAQKVFYFPEQVEFFAQSEDWIHKAVHLDKLIGEYTASSGHSALAKK